MAKLKITALPDDKPVKLTVEVPAAVHRDLQAYSEILARESGQPARDIARLIAAMVTTVRRDRSRICEIEKIASTSEDDERLTPDISTRWDFERGVTEVIL